MRLRLLLLFSIIAYTAKSQCDNRLLFDYFSEPIIDENGQLFISFDLSDKVDSSCKVEFISLNGKLYFQDKDKKSLFFSDILPFKRSDKSVEFYIDKKVTLLNRELKYFQWTEVRFNLNYKLNGTLGKTQELRYINQQYFKDSKINIAVKNFVKNAQTKKVSLSLEVDRSVSKIESIEVFNNQTKTAQAEGRDIDSRNNLFILSCADDLEDCLIGLRKYSIKVTFSDINGTQNSIVFNDQALSQKNDFTINKNDIKGNMAYGNTKTTVTVNTTIPAEELFLTFTPSPYNDKNLSKVRFSRKSGTNEYQFDIPSDDVSFRPGKYDLTFVGKDADKNELEQNNSFYYEKKQVQVEGLKAEFEPAKGESKYKVTFSQALPKTSSVELRLMGKSEIPFKMIANPSLTEYNFSFNYSDRTIESYLGSIDTTKKEIPIQFFVDNIPASPQYLAPLKINTKEQLQKEMDEQLSKKDKKDKSVVRKFLEERQVQGDLDAAANAAIEEFKKDKNSRNWDSVWGKVVKIAPSILGAVTLLL
jgi:hypothetical protein